MRLTDYLLFKGGVLTILDVEEKAYGKQFKIGRCITILNIKPLVAQLSGQEIITRLEEAIKVSNTVSDCLPDIECNHVADICKVTDAVKAFDEKAPISCIEMEYCDKRPVQILPASMDIQGLKQDRTYIVVGGSRGLGLYTVKWMAKRGNYSLLQNAIADFNKLNPLFKNALLFCQDVSIFTICYQI